MCRPHSRSVLQADDRWSRLTVGEAPGFFFSSQPLMASDWRLEKETKSRCESIALCDSLSRRAKSLAKSLNAFQFQGNFYSI